jgi:LmbE family N-acetylglucosaminyl deacetylase
VAARALVIDENIDKRLAPALRARGFRDARAVEDLRLSGKKDHIVLPALKRLSPPVVLVTYDNDMPYAHGDQLRVLQLPLAIVDATADRTPLTETEYQYDVVHRWAHLITRLRPGFVQWFQQGSHSRVHSIHALPARARRGRRSRPSDEVHHESSLAEWPMPEASADITPEPRPERLF